MKTLNAIFFHDHVFYQDQQGLFYSGGGLPSSTWSRYLKHFNQLTVVGRKSSGILDASQRAGYALSSTSNVSFQLVDNISGIKARLKNKAATKKTISLLISTHDMVIARLTSELGLLAISEAKKQGKPWAVELVDCPWDALWSYGTITAKLYAPILYWRVRAALAQSSHALYVTKYFLQRRYPCGKATTTDCSNVEIPSLSDDVLSTKLSHIKAQAGQTKIVFGLLGSLHGKFKGIHIAMKALAKARSQLPPFEFRILGGGDPTPWKNEATKLNMQDIVFFDGVLPSGQPVYEWLDKIDIYLHPSFKEGLPRALIEAMSRACPAIATQVAGTPELLPPCFLVPPGEVNQLAEKIIFLAGSAVTQEEAAKNNFLTAKNYTSEKLNKKRDEFWQSAVRQAETVKNAR